MDILVPNEQDRGESRVALVPAVVKKLTALGARVTVASGAGVGAYCTDQAFTAAGAVIVGPQAAEGAWQAADIVVALGPPQQAQIARLKEGAVLIGMLAPLRNLPLVEALAERKVTSFSLEFIPRISRAQAMDVLSSQANLAGYKAVLIAANHCAKIFPMLMTAAGTIAPARVLIIGAGVAGLQAIATARRLGAIVEAYDVRPAVKEQVQSLGARFVELPLDTAGAETQGGYAKEQTEEQRRRQAELMARHVIGAHAVISTAAVFGKAPPLLIPRDVVQRMNPGSVIVDLAADPAAGRGNCELTKPGACVTTDNGITIEGALNLAGLVASDASAVYANNMLALLREIIVDGNVQITAEDEIQKGALITRNGQIVHGPTTELLARK